MDLEIEGECVCGSKWTPVRARRETYEEQLSHVPMRGTTRVFQTVSVQTIRPIGELPVRVKNRYEDFVSLYIFVLEPEKKKMLIPLLVRSSLEVLMPEWRKLSEIEYQYPYVFSGDASQAIEGFTADIILTQGAVPIFHKPYTVPFKFRENVEEINRMVKKGIIVPVRSSTWASPIVMTPKQDGTIRICLDGKATLNRFICTPGIEDILANLSNFKFYCKIDLTGAYLQVYKNAIWDKFGALSI
uniref:Uncharacterized protein n=1 Tax=Anopheles stephensi TaxID=30069 RepID=A0A182YQ77_ANOST